MNFMVMERRFGSDERIRVLAFSRHGQLILAGSISPEASSTFDLSSGTIRRRSWEGKHASGCIPTEREGGRREGKIDWQGGPVKFVGIIQATGILCIRARDFADHLPWVLGNYETSLLSQLNAASRWNYYFGQAD